MLGQRQGQRMLGMKDVALDNDCIGDNSTDTFSCV